MILAVIKTGGKQYLVSIGQKIRIDPRHQKIGVGTGKIEGKELIFDEVLLLQKGNKLEIGTPLVKGAKVIGKFLREGREEKIIVLKYKPKTRYKVKRGHRQPFIEVEITKIESSS